MNLPDGEPRVMTVDGKGEFVLISSPSYFQALFLLQAYYILP